MAHKPVIAFDCDDVLVNLREPMSRVIKAVTGYGVHWSKWRDYDLITRAGLSRQRFVEIMIGQRVIEMAQLDDNASSLFAQLRAAGFDIQVWTARAWHPDARAITTRQLAPLGVTANDIRLFGLSESKVQAAVESRVNALVDDNGDCIQALHELDTAAVQGLLVDRPWNQHYEQLRRCYSLKDVGRFVLAEPACRHAPA